MSTIRNTERAVREMADDAKTGVETLAHDARKGAEKLAEKAGETWQDAKAYADETLTAAGEKAAVAKDQAVDFATDMQRQLTRMVEERPLTTLAIGAGLAFALGALWKMGSHQRQPAWYEMDRWRR